MAPLSRIGRARQGTLSSILAMAVLMASCSGEEDGWRVGAYEAPTSRSTALSTPPSPDPVSAPSEAANVLRRYYAAIDARDFRGAYELWSGNGAASGQTFEEFAAGFAETARVEVEVEIGTTGRVQGAAGSRYVMVPVVIRAMVTRGEAQRFEGTYTLRRSVVDGASAEQRHWRIHSADIVRSH